MDCSELNATRSNGSSDTVHLNSSGLRSGDDPGRTEAMPLLAAAFQISMSAVPVEAFSFVVLATAGLVNGFVLTAMFKVSSVTLPAKFLLVCNLIANVTFPLSSKLPPMIIWICMAYRLNDPLTFVCLDLMTFLAPPFALVAQGLCTLSLACDRVYAVCFPLVYKIKGYRKAVKCVIIFSQLFLSITFLLPAIILPFRMKRTPPNVCSTLIPGYFMYTSKLRPVYLLITTIITFAIYAFIFVHLKCNTLVKKAEKHAEVSRKSISLTIVYFFVHFTTVLLSAPVSVYAVYVEVFTDVPPSGNTRMVLQLFLILHLMNSIIDPIILTWKIPTIRKKLPFRLNICFLSSGETSNKPTFSTRLSSVQDVSAGK